MAADLIPAGARPLYADPSVYDILVTPGTAGDLDVLQRVARRWTSASRSGGGARRPRAERWLEPACGTGRFLRVAAARGLRVTGFDASPRMIAYARASLERRGLGRRADVFVAGLTDFLPRAPERAFDFAYVPDNTLRHLPDDRAALAHFAQMARALRRGGVYAVGLSLSRYGEEEPSEDVWTGARGRCRVHELVNYLPPERGSRRERVIIHLMIERPRGAQHVDAAFDLRCWDERQWDALVRRSALRRVASLDAWGEPLAGRRLPYQLEILAPR